MFREDVGDAPAAVGELGVEVDPLSGGGLGHDVDVDLQEATTGLPVYHSASAKTARAWRAAPPHLLAGEGDHVQGAVHETPHQRLGPVLREDGVVDAMVRRHVLVPPGNV